MIKGIMQKILIFFIFFIAIIPFSWTQSEESEDVPIVDVDINVLIDEGIELERDGKNRQAIELYRQLLEQDDSIHAIKVRLAKLLSWEDKFEEALVLLNEVLAKEPENSGALFRKAQIKSWQQNYGESIELYLLYLKLEPGDADAHMGLGRVYFWNKDYEKAVDELEIAIEAGADEIDARLTLAKVYFSTDQLDGAALELAKVLQQDSENEEALRLLEGIQRHYPFVITTPFHVDVYAGNSVGVRGKLAFVYSIEDFMNFGGQYSFFTVDSKLDNTLGLSAEYVAIEGVSLRSAAFFTPAAVLGPGWGLSLGGSYVFTTLLGAGLDFSSKFFSDEILLGIVPEVTVYFSEISNAVLKYNQYIYSSGFVTSVIGLLLNIDYWDENTLSIGFTYGGDVEAKVKERTAIGVSGGIDFEFTDNFVLSASYTHVETEYSVTRQIEIAPVIRW